jgi:hypothetical protein
MQAKNARFFSATLASSPLGGRLNSDPKSGREGKPVSAHDNDAGAVLKTHRP